MTFGPKPKVMKKSFPRRMRQRVFQHALGEKVRLNNLAVLDDLRLEKPTTKILAQTVKSLNASGSVLLVTDKSDKNTLLSARNIPDVTCRCVGDVSAYDILSHSFLILTKESFYSLGLAEQ